MEITARAFWTLVHDLGFDALYLPAGSGALVELYRITTSSSQPESTLSQQSFLKVYTAPQTKSAAFKILRSIVTGT